MTIYIVHSLPLMMSVVQVFVASQMALVAHLVNADTVGSYKHLGVNFKVQLLFDHLILTLSPAGLPSERHFNTDPSYEGIPGNHYILSNFFRK